MTAPLLEVSGLRKRFGGLVAVKDVSFSLNAGEIVGILGPNGAGKTTIFNLLTGFIAADAGSVRFDGKELRGLAPYRIVNRGVARTFQLTRPFIGMSVLENVLVACLAPRVRGKQGSAERARMILAQVGLGEKASLPVEVLPYGDLRRLEIARALATDPRLLLLDEPFAGLGSSEIEPLAQLIRKLHAEENLTILIIEHKLREFMALVSRVVAVDFGEVIAMGSPVEVVRDPCVIEAYIGRTDCQQGQGFGQPPERHQRAGGRLPVSLLEVVDLQVRYGKALALESVTLHVEPGELVGVLGPNGAGKTTLLKAISRTVPSSGNLTFKGESISGTPAHRLVARGICHCPEGRRLFPELSVLKNLELGAYLRRDRAEVAADLKRVYALFPVLEERQKQQASTLSGGEQQMVAIGRALMGKPQLLLLDEPSVGIAHRLKMQIFEAIRQIRQTGTAILLVEQDAASTFSIADRIYLLEHGRAVREGTAAALSRDDYVRQIYLGV